MEYQGPRGTSVKITEKPGLAMMAMLMRKKRFRRPTCGRPKCPLISSGSGCFDTCYQEGIIYTGTCRICEQTNIKSVYIGETSRTLHTRANQHLSDLKRTISNSRNRTDSVGDQEGL